MDILKKFVNDVYCNYNKKDNVLYYHTSNNGTFKLGIPKSPRIFPTLTPSMNSMILDVDFFMNGSTKLKYKKNGIPHRRGYLIHGPPATGKSSIVEYIAMKYDMNPYVIIFNDINMTDSTLITLLNRVPMNSIILIDEIDRQLETLNLNPNKQLFHAGILSALAGAERLSESVLIILTTNDINKLDPNFKTSLVRIGRIDTILEFKEQFLQTI
jgi:chaperone BCS1